MTEQEVLQDVAEETETGKGGNQPDSVEMTRDTVTHETGETQENTQRHETDESQMLQDCTKTETEIRRTQRVRRAPSILTYDTPGHPSVIAAPIVRYVSCLYKWIGAPVIS